MDYRKQTLNVKIVMLAVSIISVAFGIYTQFANRSLAIENTEQKVSMARKAADLVEAHIIIRDHQRNINSYRVRVDSLMAANDSLNVLSDSLHISYLSQLEIIDSLKKALNNEVHPIDISFDEHFELFLLWTNMAK